MTTQKEGTKDRGGSRHPGSSGPPSRQTKSRTKASVALAIGSFKPCVWSFVALHDLTWAHRGSEGGQNGHPGRVRVLAANGQDYP